jgi:hypothetical protein
MIREGWARLVADTAEVDPVEMVFDHERPLRVISAIGTMRRHVDEWSGPLTVGPPQLATTATSSGASS